MSNDPWAVQEERTQTDQFVKTRIEMEEKTGTNGNAYHKITIFITPIEPEKQIKEHNTFDFKLDWQKITIPSVQKLMQVKKISSPSEMQSGQFCTICWNEFKDRSSYRIAKKKKEGYGKYVETDEKGEYILYVGVNFTNVFTTEDEWREAYNDTASNQQIELPVDQNSEGERTDPALEAAKAAIPNLVQAAGIDMTALQQSLSHPPFNNFSLQDDFVKREVAKLVATRAGTSAENQEKLLAEINSHFNDDTLYLTIDSPELTSQLKEIPF